MDRVQNIMNKAMEYRSLLDNYAYLWVDDRNEFMRQFLLYNHVLTTEEIEAHAEEGVLGNPPTLNQFKDQIDSYEKINDEVQEFKPTTLFDTWFRVDARPFQQALPNTIKKWSLMFKQHLIDHVTNSLNDLFTSSRSQTLVLRRRLRRSGQVHGSRDRGQGQTGYDGRDVRTSQADDRVVASVRTGTFGRSPPTAARISEQWKNTKKTSITAKQQVAPLQANKVANISKKSADFDVRQHKFREEFRKILPFLYICEAP